MKWVKIMRCFLSPPIDGYFVSLFHWSYWSKIDNSTKINEESFRSGSCGFHQWRTRSNITYGHFVYFTFSKKIISFVSLYNKNLPMFYECLKKLNKNATESHFSDTLLFIMYPFLPHKKGIFCCTLIQQFFVFRQHCLRWK